GPRRLIFAGALLLSAGVGVGLALVTAAGTTEVWAYLALAVAAGIAMAFGWPAARAMPPTLVPLDLLQNAMVLRSIASQAGMVIGPAVGGLLYGGSPGLLYLLATGCSLVSSAIVLAMHPRPAAEVAAPGEAGGQAATVETALEGLRFVLRTQVLLGAILLDLLAVLFGGAVALLPVFARSILHAGPQGLGILRAAPAVGARPAAAALARRAPVRGAGRPLLAVVRVFRGGTRAVV